MNKNTKNYSKTVNSINNKIKTLRGQLYQARKKANWSLVVTTNELLAEAEIKLLELTKGV